MDDLGAAIGILACPWGQAPMRPKPNGGIYVSDDAGATWRLVNGEIACGPADGTSADRRRSQESRSRVRHQHRYLYDPDAGKTFVPIKGAPGGDDYHQLWMNPKDGNRMVLSSDQGTVV